METKQSKSCSSVFLLKRVTEEVNSPERLATCFPFQLHPSPLASPSPLPLPLPWRQACPPRSPFPRLPPVRAPLPWPGSTPGTSRPTSASTTSMAPSWATSPLSVGVRLNSGVITQQYQTVPNTGPVPGSRRGRFLAFLPQGGWDRGDKSSKLQMMLLNSNIRESLVENLILMFMYWSSIYCSYSFTDLPVNTTESRNRWCSRTDFQSHGQQDQHPVAVKKLDICVFRWV